MGGNYNRIYTRTNGQVASGPNVDEDIDNIIANSTPAGLDDASENLTAMQAAVDPYPAGSPSLPTSTEGELQRLRFQLKAILGEAQWYIDPDFNIAEMYGKKGADVASDSALPLLNDGDYNDVTGTTTITSMDTVKVGTTKILHFDAILTLTHDASDLILPTGANITTAAGDIAIFKEYATGDWECIGYQRASGKALKGEDYILIQDQKASATDGGTFTSGAWRTRNLNTEVVDTGSNASISSNQVTLLAGTYRFKATSPGNTVTNHQAKLVEDVGGTPVDHLGSSEFSEAESTISTISGRFTITSSTAFEVQHRCDTTKTTNGFGVSNGYGIQVYAQIEFWKEV